VSQAEVDWLVSDVQGRIGKAGGSHVRRETSQDNHSLGDNGAWLDKNAEGDDNLEPEGKKDPGDGPGSSEEAEQRAMVSIYLIPLMKPISIVYFGLTKIDSNHFKHPASAPDIVTTVKSVWPLIEAYSQSDKPESLMIVNDQLDIHFKPFNIRGSEQIFQQARKSIMKVINVIYMDKAREHFEELLEAITNVRSFPC